MAAEQMDFSAFLSQKQDEETRFVRKRRGRIRHLRRQYVVPVENRSPLLSFGFRAPLNRTRRCSLVPNPSSRSHTFQTVSSSLGPDPKKRASSSCGVALYIATCGRRGQWWRFLESA